MRLRLSICASLVLLLIPILTYSTPAINKQLRIRGGIDSPPYEFINEDGQPDGFNVELIKALMSTLDLDYDLQLDELTAIRQQLDSGEIDLIIGLLYSEKRTQTIAFSLPHNYIYQTVVTRKDSPFRSIKDLRGKSVFVQEHGRAEEAMHEFGLNDELVPVKKHWRWATAACRGQARCHSMQQCDSLQGYKRAGANRTEGTLATRNTTNDVLHSGQKQQQRPYIEDKQRAATAEGKRTIRQDIQQMAERV